MLFKKDQRRRHRGLKEFVVDALQEKVTDTDCTLTFFINFKKDSFGEENRHFY